VELIERTVMNTQLVQTLVQEVTNAVAIRVMLEMGRYVKVCIRKCSLKISRRIISLRDISISLTG
jgi:hypothetical protein